MTSLNFSVFAAGLARGCRLMSRFGGSHGVIAYKPLLPPKRLTVIRIKRQLARVHVMPNQSRKSGDSGYASVRSTNIALVQFAQATYCDASSCLVCLAFLPSNPALPDCHTALPLKCLRCTSSRRIFRFARPQTNLEFARANSRLLPRESAIEQT